MPTNSDTPKDGVWWALSSIQNDLARMDEKWDNNIAAMTRTVSELNIVTQKVSELNKLLTVDNGKPSVVSQLRSLSDEVKETKQLLQSIRNDLETVKTYIGIKTPKEVQLERLRTVGKVAAATGLVLPGILSFLHTFVGL